MAFLISRVFVYRRHGNIDFAKISILTTSQSKINKWCEFHADKPRRDYPIAGWKIEVWSSKTVSKGTYHCLGCFREYDSVIFETTRRRRKVYWGARKAQWWEHSPPTNFARVLFPVLTPYVCWVCCNCCFSSLLPGFFSGYSCFPSSTKSNIPKLQFDLETVCERAILWKPLKFPSMRYFITQRLFCNSWLVICINSLTNNRKHRQQKISQEVINLKLTFKNELPYLEI